eukprot:TRINITY_DN2729_c1_g1_i3.p1 TRINITY_DN2729_c1_g1~~TRINITY_DN2729_c1_g1_i3.p1  ORF type:complete len:4594 (+),score=1260.51 TRINITY_DN2729_c1_g1_i3:1283-13783(+)
MGVVAAGHLAHALGHFQPGDTQRPQAVLDRCLSRFHAVFSDAPKAEEAARHLPLFISGVAAAVCACPGELPAATVSTLSGAVRCAFAEYAQPRMFESTRARVRASILILLLAVYAKGDALSAILSREVWPAVALMVSATSERTAQPAADEDGGGGSGGSTFDAGAAAIRRCVPLWAALIGRSRPLPDPCMYPWSRLLSGAAHHQHLAAEVFDALAAAVLDSLSALDLAVTAADEASPPSQGEVARGAAEYDALNVGGHRALRPRCPRDFELCINLTRLWCELLPEVADVGLLRDWAPALGRRVAELAQARPHVSSFYALLTCISGQCTRHSYWADLPPPQRDPRGDVVAPDSAALSPAAELRLLLSRFAAGALRRCGEYKGELLTACLTFLLTLPLQCINLSDMAGPVGQALRIGLACPPVAAVATDAVESWLDWAPGVVRRHLAAAVLAPLQNFVAQASAVEGAAEEPSSTSRPPTLHSRGRRWVPPSVAARPVAASDGAAAAERLRWAARRGLLFEASRGVSDAVLLPEVRLQAARVLGKLGSGVVAALSRPAAEESPWDASGRRITMRVNLGEVKIELCCDSLLPRVCTLAQTSHDRKTKIASCELLHAMVLWMVGSNARRPAQLAAGADAAQQGKDFAALYRKVFPVLLRLAVDTEPVAQQLFAPLTMQLVHWLSQNVHYEARETVALLDAIVDGLGEKGETALREFCATAAAEFAQYSTKYGQDSGRRNISSLTARIYGLCTHPQSAKRRGAAAALGCLLREMRSGTTFLAAHLLGIVYHAVLALTQEPDDGVDSGSAAPLVQLLGQAERLVVLRRDLLLDAADGRRATLPQPCRSLDNAVGWLFEQCFYNQRATRRVAMRLFITFAGSLPGFDESDDGPRRWLDARYGPTGGVAGICRNMEDDMTPLPAQPQLGPIPVSRYKRWAVEIETAAEGREWLLTNGLAAPAELCSSRQQPRQGRGSSLARHINLFLSHAAAQGAAAPPCAADSQLSLGDDLPLPAATAGPDRRPATPAEQRALAQRHARALDAAMRLVALIAARAPDALRGDGGDCLTSSNPPLLCPAFWRAVLGALLTPPAAGVGAGRSQQPAEVAHQTLRLVVRALHARPAVWARELRDLGAAVRGAVHPAADPYAPGGGVSDLLQRGAAAVHAVRGLRALHAEGLLCPAVSSLHSGRGLESPPGAAAALFALLTEADPALLAQPAPRQVAAELLRLVFALGLPGEHLCAALSDATPLSLGAVAANRVAPDVTVSFGPSFGMGGVDDDADLMELDEDDPFRSQLQAPRAREGAPPRAGAAATLHRGAVLAARFRAELCDGLLEAPDVLVPALAAAAAAAGGGPPLELLVAAVAAAAARAAPDPAADSQGASGAPSSQEGGSGFVAACAACFPALTAAAAAADPASHFATAVSEAVAGLLRLRGSTRISDALSSAAMDLAERAVRAEGGVLPQSPERVEAAAAALAGLVPYLVRCNCPSVRARAAALVSAVVSDQLPVHPAEVLEEDDDRAPAYCRVVGALADALRESRSPVLLAACLPLFRGSGGHPLAGRMVNALGDFFASQDTAVLMRCADDCVKCFSNSAMPTDVRFAAVRRVCVVALRRLAEDGRPAMPPPPPRGGRASPQPASTPPRSGPPAIEEFFRRHVAALYRTVAADWPTVHEYGAGQCDAVRSAFVTRSCAYQLLELMYRLCSPEASKEVLNDVFVAEVGLPTAGAPTGKELNDKMIRAAHHTFTADLGFAAEQGGEEAVRQLRQAAFGCLAEAMMATQRKQELFRRALFQPARPGGALWEHVVPTGPGALPTFGVQTNFRTVPQALERTRTDWEAAGHGQEGLERFRPNYLSSQYLGARLGGSSLAAAAAHPHAPPCVATASLCGSPAADGALAARPADAGDPFAAGQGDGDAVGALSQAGAVPLRLPAPLAQHREGLRMSQQRQEAGPGSPRGGAGGGAAPRTPARTPGAAAAATPGHGGGILSLGGHLGPLSGSPGDGAVLPRAPQWPADSPAEIWGPASERGDLELDPLNANPCMPVLLRLCAFMIRTFPGSHGEVPAWMAEMLAKVRDPGCPAPVRFFLVKVVVNAAALFQQYAAHWVGPLCDAAVRASEGRVGEGFNYYVRDVCITLLQWGDDARLNGVGAETSASELLVVLFKGAGHQYHRVLKANLDIIRQLLERWRGRVRLGAQHRKIIMHWITASVDMQDWVRARVVGLHLLATLVANRIPAYDPTHDAAWTSEDGFYAKICASLPPVQKGERILPTILLEPCAEVVGMVLAQLAADSTAANDRTVSLARRLQSKLQQLHDSHDYRTLLVVLGKVSRHYPQVADPFLPHGLLYMLNMVREDAYSALALEIMGRRSGQTSNLYGELQSLVPPLLKEGRSEATQLVALEVLGKALLQRGSAADVNSFVLRLSEQIAALMQGCLSLDPRVAVYDIWIKVFDTKWSVLTAESKKALTELLLGGLRDEATYVRDKMLRFWDDGSRLPGDAFSRLERLFSPGGASDGQLGFFSPQLGDRWLQYAAILLLFLSHRSADFTDRAAWFPCPIAECEFIEVAVDPTGGSGARAVMLTPMFAHSATPATQTSTPAVGTTYTSSVTPARRPAGGRLLATPGSAAFTQTQATNFAHYQPKQTPALTQTGLLFDPHPDPAAVHGAAEAQQHVARRFRQRAEEGPSKARHARYAVWGKARRDREEREDRLRRQSNVQMWRAYREGEVPDVQIPPQAVIVPLEALCLYDADVASGVMLELCRELLGALDPKRAGDSGSGVGASAAPPMGMTLLGPLERPAAKADRVALLATLAQGAAQMLRTVPDSPGVVSFVHSIAIDTPAIGSGLQMEDAHSSAVLSHNLHSGLLLIESDIQRKRSRSAELERELWRRGGVSLSGDSLGSDALAGDSDGALGLAPRMQEVQRLRSEAALAWEKVGDLYQRTGDEDAAHAVVEDHLLSGDAAAAVGLVIAGSLEQAVPALEACIERRAAAEGEAPGAKRQRAEAEADAGECRLPPGRVAALLRRERRRCLAQLLKWSDLVRACDQEADLLDDSLWQGQQSELLEQHIESRMRSGVGDEAERLSCALEHALTDRGPAVAAALRRRHGLPLALLAAQRGDECAARSYVSASLRSFLEQWAALPAALRGQPGVRRLLASLQPLTELHEYLEFKGHLHNDPERSPDGLMLRWAARTAAFEGGPAEWDQVVFVRKLLCRLLANRGPDGRITVSEADSRGHLCSVLLRAAEQLDAQGAATPARMFLSECAEMRGTATGGGAEGARFTAVVVRNSIRRAQRSTAVDRVVNLHQRAMRYVIRDGERQMMDAVDPALRHLLLGEAHRSLALTLARLRDSGTAVPSADIGAAATEALSSLSAAARQGSAQGLEQLGQWCDTLLADRSLVAAAPGAAGVAELSKALVESHLKALGRGGSRAARVRLPRVLEVASQEPAAARALSDAAPRVARGHLLPWISQLLGYLQSDLIGDTVCAMLGRVAQQFSQQMYFAVGACEDDLSRQHYASAAAARRIDNLRIALDRALEGEDGHGGQLLRDFSRACERMHNPDLRLRYWLAEMEDTLREFNAGGLAEHQCSERFASLWKQLQEDCFPLGARKEEKINSKFSEACRSRREDGIHVPDKSGASSPPRRVPLFDDIAAYCVSIAVDAAAHCRRHGSSAVSDFGRKRLSWLDAVKAHWPYVKLVGTQPLEQYSAWLACFRGAAQESGIQLPQQAMLTGGDSAEEGVGATILSFAQQTLVMDSIQKPKRLVVHASDEQEHAFLVKGGEDLRQDQRIQQIFSVMDQVLQGERGCGQRGLRLRTYSVVPLSPRAGLVEWVGGCKPLKAMLQENFRASDTIHGKGLLSHPAAGKFLEWVNNLGHRKQLFYGYRRLFGEYGRTDLTPHFSGYLEEPLMDLTYLKRALTALCVSHAAYHRLRSRFLASWSACGAAQWMLGIGDRHCDNFLIDQQTAEAVPIDFGHAFGSATETLGLPELLPMRVTPQIQEVAQPVGVALLKGVTAAALGALRSEKSLLLDVLSVFIREPLAHWQRNAVRRLRRRGDGATPGSEPTSATAPGASGQDRVARSKEAYAEAKVAQVRRKLDLGNPWVFVAEDVDQNQNCGTVFPDSASRERLKLLLRGEICARPRAAVPAVCRSVAEQAACLIDMATDPNLLCRTYVGWGPIF